MAQGEKRWSGSGDAVKRTFTPVASQDWEVKMDTNSAEIGAGSKEKGGIPFIKGVRFVCFGSATVEGGKDSLIFQNFFLSLKEGKDGNVMPDYANQLKGLMKALGDVRNDVPSASKVINEEGETVDYLSPKWVLAYLKEHNGEVFKLHSKIENDPVYGKKAVVDYFIEAEEGASGGEEETEEETEEAEEEIEETEAEIEEEEEPEPTPIKKKTTVKAAPVQLKKKAR